MADETTMAARSHEGAATGPPTGTERRERTRLALLQAGAEVFARRGLHGSSLDEVAEAAGYTKGAIYDHFGSKDDFFFAVVDHRATERFEHFADLVDRLAAEGVEELTSAVARQLVETLRPARRGALLDAEAWLHAQRSPDARERLAEHQRLSLARVVELLEGLRDRLGIDLAVPPTTLAALLNGAAVGLTQMALTDASLDVGPPFHVLTGLGWDGSH